MERFVAQTSGWVFAADSTPWLDRQVALGLVLPLAALALGFVLLMIARRGRRTDDHPICRNCGFDLFGLPAGRTVCSECGTDVRRPNAIRIGRREPIRLLIFVSLFLLMPSATWLGALGVSISHGANFDPHKPLWWLAMDARSGEHMTRERAIKEIASRSQTGRMSGGQTLYIASLALATQGDVTRPWEPAWGDWIEAAHVNGLLPESTWQRYLLQGVAFKLEIRGQVRQGDPLPIRVTVGSSGRLGSASDVSVQYEASLEVAGMTIPLGARRCPDITAAPSAEWVLPADKAHLDALAQGDQSAQITLDVDVADAAGHSSAHTRIQIKGGWKLLPADEPSVTMKRRPDIREAVEKSVRLCSICRTEQKGAVDLSMQCDCPPIGLACKIHLRQGKQEWELGRAAFAAGQFNVLRGRYQVPGLSSGPVDLILSSCPETAAATVDLKEAWDGSIVFRNVPLGSPAAPPLMAAAW